jgi:hypothetical protein
MPASTVNSACVSSSASSRSGEHLCKLLLPLPLLLLLLLLLQLLHAIPRLKVLHNALQPGNRTSKLKLV